MTKGRATIAVVSWNTCDLLDICLSSLSEAVSDRVAEIVVVDNGSSDGSVDMVRQRHPDVQLISSPANVGFGNAVNLGLANARSEWVIAANADIEVPASAIDQLIQLGDCHPRFGALGPRLVLPSGETQESSFDFPSIRAMTAAALGLHRLRRPRRGSNEPHAVEAVDFAMGAFLVIRREAFEEIGGFAKEQWMYAEDLDLCWRLRAAGWLTGYVESTWIRHVGGASSIAAFGAASGTPQVVGALYEWLRLRRGLSIAWMAFFINLTSVATRVLAYRTGVALGVAAAPRRLKDARSWLHVTWRAGVQALFRRDSN